MGLIEEIKDILPYIRIAHHIPGRIRLKLDMDVLKKLPLSELNAPSTLLKLFERLSNVDFETELTKVKNSFSQDNPKVVKSLKAMKNLLESDNSPETIRQALNALFPELPPSTRSAIVNLYERFVVK